MREHFYEFAMWLDDKDGVSAPMVRFSTWSKWHAHHMAALRSRSTRERVALLLGRDVLPRLVLFFACCAALDVDEYLPPEQQVVTTTWVSTAGGGNGSAANGTRANGTQTSEMVGTTETLAKPHFRAAMLFACGCLTLTLTLSLSLSLTLTLSLSLTLTLTRCGCLFWLVCLPLYLLTDHRFVRRGVLPASLWWHIGFSWSVRAAAIAGHVWLCFWSFAEFLG